MAKRKKRPMTLLEIMVVIFIIGIVGTVIGVNMKGSLEQGKAFKSEQGSRQIYEILNLEMAKGSAIPTKLDSKTALRIVKDSGLAKDAKKLMEDGWGRPYRILVKDDESDIRVISDSFVRYMRTKKKMSHAQINEKYTWMDETNCREIAEAS
ncbi:MAG: type II secretion system GspH family protein [Simkaniaceae bacterium]|nr:type II secretion system GspH family protein [Simkaniaceae bacterium]